MRGNILVIIGIVMLFAGVFIIGNVQYFSKKHTEFIENGVVTIEDEQLRTTTKLVGEWAFYPNVLIPAEESLASYAHERILIKVPGDLTNYVQRNKEGVSVGTYHLKVNVPIEEQYGLYIQTIRQANRVFINGVEVGSKGNPTATFSERHSENADKYTVFAHSNNRELDIVIHVSNYNYPQAN
ncbi:hypothetical protein [Metasolibacillus meyeri]|uniref:hypothetical protein n=1 Tax=Metasolibacillus meyeri TaxID=1071052 RepID=UPI000D305F95|nr:hypothetical protein [Metasolibacillus meyeri]